jgi:hypothetical protein
MIMKRLLRILILTSLFFLPIATNNLISSPFGGYNETRYPQLGLIVPHKGSVWFIGRWDSKAIAVQRNPTGQWHTYVYTIKQGHYFDISQSNNLIIFPGELSCIAFDLDSTRWIQIEKSRAQIFQKYLKRKNNDENKSPRLKIIQGDSLLVFDFPLPSYNAYRRWVRNPTPPPSLQAQIGDTITLHNCTWFTINFYDSEGISGIGGLGLFDPQIRKYGILRDPWLTSASANQLFAKGDTIFITTSINAEYGTMECSGLVMVDTRHGRMTHANNRNSPLIGETFNAIKLIDDYLWMSTDEAIVGWDLKHDEWCAVRMDSVLTTHDVNLSRCIRRSGLTNDRIWIYGDSLVTLMNKKSNFRLNLLWLEGSNAEVKCESMISGWVSKDELRQYYQSDREGKTGNSNLRVFSDSTLSIPFNLVKFGDIIEGPSSEKAIFVKTNSLWCDISHLDPIYSVVYEKKKLSPEWTVHGGSLELLKNEAFNEFRREQQEIEEKIPVYDTTLIINKDMDLYDTFNDILDMRWLTNSIYSDPSPHGILFEIEPWDSRTKVNLSCYYGNLAIDGVKYTPGSEYLIQTPHVIATLSFTDAKFAGPQNNTLASVTIKYKLVLLP